MNELSLTLRLIILGVGAVAVTVNAFVLVLVVRIRQSLHGLSYQLVGIISIIDLLSGLNAIVGFGVMQAKGVTESFADPVYCPVFGFVGNMTIIVSGMLMAALAYERYSLVCKEEFLSPALTFGIVGALAVAFAVPAGVASALRLLEADALDAYCNVKDDGWGKASNYMTFPMYILPLLLLIFCYVSILLRVMRSSPALIDKRMVAYKSFLLITIYSVCFLPKFVSLTWKYASSRRIPDSLNILAPTGINFLNIVNPILILFLHNQFKSEAIELLSPSRYRIHRPSLRSFPRPPSFAQFS